MAQFVNMELVENLRPFIAKVVTDMSLGGEVHYSDAVTNPDLPLKSDANGDLILANLEIGTNGQISTSAGTLTITPVGDLNLYPQSSKVKIDSDLTFPNGGDISGPVLTISPGSLTLEPADGNVDVDADITFINSDPLISNTIGTLTVDGTNNLVLKSSAGSVNVSAFTTMVLQSVSTFTLISDSNFISFGSHIIFTIPNARLENDTGTLSITSQTTMILTSLTELIQIDSEVISLTASNPTISGTTGTITLSPTGDLNLYPQSSSVKIDSDLVFIFGGDISGPVVNIVPADLSLEPDTLTIEPTTGYTQILGDVGISSGLYVGDATLSATIGTIVLQKPNNGGATAINLRDLGYTNGITHGMTHASNYGEIYVASATVGGLLIKGYSTSTFGVFVTGSSTVASSTITGDARAPIIFKSYASGGTVLDTDNLYVFSNVNTSKVVIKGDGHIHTFGGSSMGGGLYLGDETVLSGTGALVLHKPNGHGGIAIQFTDSSFTAGTSHGLYADDNYAEFYTASPAGGGIQLKSYSTSNHATWLMGSVTTGNSVVTGDARAPLIFQGFKVGSTIAWNENLATFKTSTGAKFTIRGNGDFFSQSIGYFGWGISIGDFNAQPLQSQILFNDGGRSHRAILLASTVMNHTATDIDPANTYLSVAKYAVAAGGAQFIGYSIDRPGLVLDGYAQVPDNSTATWSIGNVMFRAYYPNGTSMAGLPAGYNTYVFRNGPTTDFIFKVGGIAYANVSWSVFDEEDDMSIVRAAANLGKGVIQNKWDRFVTHNEQDLHEMGLVVNGMTNMTGMMQLHNGALWQLHTRIAELENVSITGMIKLILNRWLRRFV